MTRSTAIIVLGSAACLGLALSGAVHPAIAPACLLAFGVRAFVLERRRWRLADLAQAAAHTALVGTAAWLALLRHPPLPLLETLLACAGPFLVLCSLGPATVFSEFLILLVSLLLVTGSAAVAPGATPLAITALYVLVACQVLPVLGRRRDDGDAAASGVRVRRIGRTGWWARAGALATYHLGMAGLLLGGLLYLVLPRPETSFEPSPPGSVSRLLDRRALRPRGDPAAAAARRGFPRRLSLGDLGRIKRDGSTLLEAGLRAAGQPYDPAAEERSLLLLRARAWERYDPALRRWTEPHRVVRPLPVSGRIEAGAAPLDWEILNLGYGGRTLFLPPRPKRIRCAASPLVVDRQGLVHAPRPVDRYGVEAAWPVRSTGEWTRLECDYRKRELLELPRGLAERLRPFVPRRAGPRLVHAVAAVRAYFAKRDFRYTLDFPAALARSRTPIIAFLERREGHCELFASAGCLMLRAMGVPARLAGGLRLAERLAPGRYRARSRNAHAWVEIPCVGVGYVAVDFTPPDARAAGPGGAAASGADGATSGSGETASAPLIDWSDPFRYGARERARTLRWMGERIGSWPFLALFGGGLMAWFAWLLRGVRRRRRDPTRVHAPRGLKRRTLAFYARWLKRCAALGYRRAPAQTPREFLVALPEELRVAGGRITAQFERLRYGGAACHGHPKSRA